MGLSCSLIGLRRDKEISRFTVPRAMITLKFCGCDLNLKTFNNMQQVPWFLFSANRNYILFLNLLICQPHRHVIILNNFRTDSFAMIAKHSHYCKKGT